MTDPLATAVARGIAGGGARVAFGVPGGGANLDVVGALGTVDVEFVLTHGETAAAIMASTYGLLTGSPTLALATRGPGATSAVNGAAQATLDRAPLLLVTDTVHAADAGRVAHQRVDQRALFAPVTKWSGTLGAVAPDRTVTEALRLATAPLPGAVHLDHDPSASGDVPSAPVVLPPPAAADHEQARDLVARARRPLAIVGVGARADAAAVRRLLDGWGVPVLTTYQAAGVIDSDSDTAAGLFTNGASEQPLVDEADLVVAIGLDPVEPIPAPWRSSAPVVAIHPVPLTDAYYEPVVALIGSVAACLAAVLDGAPTPTWPTGAGARHRETVRAALRRGATGFGPLDVVDAVVASRPPSTTATVDAGAHFLAVMPMWPAATPLSILISNGLATMGYSLPAAIGAALARPERPVACLVGDGGLGLTLAELETVARLDLPITVVVFDDAGLSLIKIKQGDAHGGPPAVDYRPIDFAAVAHGCGLGAETVDTAAALRRVLAGGWDRPRLVAARIAPDHYAHLLAVTRGS